MVGVWHYVVMTFSTSTDQINLYVDGSIETHYTQTTGSTTETDDNTMSFYMGAINFDSRDFDGRIDEGRVVGDLRTAAEIKFEYYNMNEVDNELDWGSQTMPTAEDNAVFFGTNF